MSATAAPPDSAEMPRPVIGLDQLPLARIHLIIVGVGALGLFLDIAELALSNALSAIFSAPGQALQPYQLPLLLASVFIGGTLGAPLLGRFSDLCGRRAALAAALAILAVTSAMAAASGNIGALTLARMLSGLAIGAWPPLFAAYMVEVLPARGRGRLIFTSAALGLLGAPAVVFLIRALGPVQPLGLEAWRWALIVGAGGSALTAGLFLLLPESPRWLLARGRSPEAARTMRRLGGQGSLAPAAEVGPERSRWRNWSGEHKRRALLIAAVYFLSPWATVGFPLLNGAVLMKKGFSLSDSLLYSGITQFGPALGTFLASFVVDRCERRLTLVILAGAMALLGLVFAAGEAPATLMASGILFSLMGVVFVCVLGLYVAELFPVGPRAMATTGTWAVSRVASALTPLALVPLLHAWGSLAMFAAIATALLACLLLLLAFGPRGLAGKPIE